MGNDTDVRRFAFALATVVGILSIDVHAFGQCTVSALTDSSSPPVAAEGVPMADDLAEVRYVPPRAEEPGCVPLMPYWDHGLRLISDDEQFNLHVRGNLPWDSRWLIGPLSVLGAPFRNATGTENVRASNLRRTRVKADGNIYGTFDYSVEFDPANAVNDNKGLQNPTQENVLRTGAKVFTRLKFAYVASMFHCPAESLRAPGAFNDER